MYNWVIDISIYQSLTVQELITLKANGLAGVIIKSSQAARVDADLDYNVQNMRQVEIPYGFYHWCDPVEPVGPQVELIQKLEKQYSPNFWAMDQEQWWSNWGQWYAKVVQGQDIVLTKFSPSFLYSFYNDIFDRVNAVTELPLLVYSANWFIEGYCPLLPRIIKKAFGYWNARYFYWVDANKNKKMSFDELHTFINSQTETKLWNELPEGVPAWMLWQLCEAPIESIETLDLNIIRPADATSLFKVTQTIPPVTEPTPVPGACALTFKVVKGPLNVRTGPRTGYTKVGSLVEGQVIIGEEITGNDVWIKLGDQKYSAMKVNSTVYMELQDDK